MSLVDIPIIKYENGKTTNIYDAVAQEEPLEILINDQPCHITMRLPGEEIPLILGFLFTEGVIGSIEEVLTLSHCNDVSGNRMNVHLKTSTDKDLEKFISRKSSSFTHCGTCGKDIVTNLSQSLSKIPKTVNITFPQLAEFQSKLIKGQQTFQHTGGTHAAGIFDRYGTLLALSEDIGRHNALDKSIGKVLLARKADEAKILILSSRLSYELVSKAALLNMEIVTGVSSATSLAVELAKNMEMTLIAFHRGQRGNICSCPERITLEE
ncbi:MAG: formate dehydrogenase accessory sulfurtransferase FdhD [Pseudomonadota bacterium]|nr:formate dehydrogenase accessory sulfurtransferase FdhD [Pseudomonadota bacterium]